MDPSSSLSDRRQCASAQIAKADAHRARKLAIASHDDRISILEKTAYFAIRQCKRLRCSVGQLEQRPRLVRFWPGLRASTKEIAWLQVAAIDGVMRNHLRDRPIRMPEAG